MQKLYWSYNIQFSQNRGIKMELKLAETQEKYEELLGDLTYFYTLLISGVDADTLKSEMEKVLFED